MSTPVQIKAGRAFKAAYDSLGNGDKARLRRADDPQTVGAFWQCFNAARTIHEKAYPKSYADTVPLLDLVTQPMLEQLEERNRDLDVGQFLADHRARVSLRRVEALLSEEYPNELIDNLESVFTMLKGETLDFGHLINDLGRFSFSESRSSVRQRWAKAYFS